MVCSTFERLLWRLRGCDSSRLFGQFRVQKHVHGRRPYVFWRGQLEICVRLDLSMVATQSLHSRLSDSSKRNMKKSISLTVLFLLSLFAHLDFSSTNQQDFLETNVMNIGGSDGYHSSSPIVLSGSTNVSFLQDEQPYRWFSIEGYQGPTYINITANTSTSDYYSQGMVKGYTAYDQCVSTWFTVGYGVSSMCSNPSGNPTILFSISFLDSADG